MENKEYTMEELLNESNRELHVHDVVKGEVVQVSDKEAKIDLGTFTEGTIYLNHFTTDKNVMSLKELLHVGDVIEAEVTKITEREGTSEILLSRLNTVKKEAYETFKNANPEGSNVEAKVMKLLTGRGYILDSNGVELFLHVNDLRDKTLNAGEKLVVKIREYNDEHKSARCSRYDVIKEERQQAYEAKEASKKEELESYKVGDVVEGVVDNIVPYGVFVKLGLVNGLIRLKEVDHKFIKSASEVLSLGDKISAKVISNENGKLELSRKALLKTPYELYKDAHNVSDTVNGKIVNKMPFGLLVELAPNLTGLIHISELSWNPNDNYMASHVIGDEIEASIIKFEDDSQKVGLSRKPLLDNPWSRVEAQVGDEVTCKVTEVLEREFKVECLGVDGTLPFNNVAQGEKNLKATDIYQVGDELKAIIADINPKRWILVLSEKAYKLKEERAQFENYMNNQEEESSVTLGDLFKDQLK